MKFDFNDRPFIVIWEVTRACILACRHSRAVQVHGNLRAADPACYLTDDEVAAEAVPV